MEQPDTRSFMLTPAFRDIAARYELPDKKAFTRLLRFLEGAQGYHESEQGSVKTSNITYQCLTESCASFAKTMKDYVVEDLGGKRVKAEDEARLFMTPFQISCEKAKMAFVNFLASTFLKWSIRRKKEILERDITLKGIPLKSIFEGRRVEEMEGYGSLEQRVEDQTFNLYLPRSLALEIIEEEFYLHHQFQTVKS